MAQTAQKLDIPLLATEQNVEIFGRTLTLVAQTICDVPKYKFQQKDTFSMINKDTLPFLKQNQEIKSAVLYGVETHVCIQQTCLDLLGSGYDVHILVDGVSSINDLDRQAGLRRMENAGAFLTTCQSVIFELLQNYKDPNFKEMLVCLKEQNKHNNKFHL